LAVATREALRDPEGKYRRAQVRAVAQRVEVLSTTEIKIMGGKDRASQNHGRLGGRSLGSYGTSQF
jgi:hypothetical protein